MLKSLTLYTALALSANAAAAAPALQAPLRGDMADLEVHEAPREVSGLAVTTPDGAEVRLADYQGTPVVLNFWATWCGPCKVEMPSLDRLQADLGDRAQVVTVATLRQSHEEVAAFFEDEGLENLPQLVDPNGALAREMGALSLPVTVLIDAEGREVARLVGPAEWDGPDARAVVDELAGTD